MATASAALYNKPCISEETKRRSIDGVRRYLTDAIDGNPHHGVDYVPCRLIQRESTLRWTDINRYLYRFLVLRPLAMSMTIHAAEAKGRRSP